MHEAFIDFIVLCQTREIWLPNDLEESPKIPVCTIQQSTMIYGTV